MEALSYLLLDVFTDRPYTGNPLAVVPFPKMPLTTEQMQAIATEFNLSETVFIFPPQKKGHTASLRIFTPTQELPFAGHPTVGAAVALGWLAERKEFHLEMGGRIIFEEKIGLVHVAMEVENPELGRATLKTAQLPERGRITITKEQLAATLSVEPQDLIWDDHCQPTAWSCGVPFFFVPLWSRTAVDQSRINTGVWESTLKDSWASSVFVFAFDPMNKKHHVYGRMFGPEKGIVEDPATGSAAAAFAGFLFAREKHPHDAMQWIVEQGFAMGRPSLLEITAHSQDGVLQGVHVGGQAVLIGEGRLRKLPN
ncbi:MAG TPA: PhzF family phenazine biosynthesis protein [Oligoflexus sp.]|uniref:PhzF family phenazine biosynthesis protein n=1 Tax=Oligoflexus sp. TaxID=1971216 RepID=UPI002D7F2456|nr:PhzF family phenazine biosynthesis protein [Oligoflexus sp.]HET9241194.1 PhzF family phenazine biosynthesis protein [Oligoflexus sp.]